METLLHLIDSYGILLLFAVGFAEYTGAPIAGVPVLIAVGSVAKIGGLSVAPMLLAAVAGALAADSLWYALARWKGARLVNAACRLSPNPRVCIGNIEQRVMRLGDPYIVIAKFIPGAGNLIAPAAGLAGIDPRRFLALDLVALILWASVYSGLGWVFSSQVESVIMIAESYVQWAIMLGAMLVGVGALYRYLKGRTHAAMHAAG